MKPFIKIDRYCDQDVIVTSGLMSGMTEESYQLSIGDCGWWLVGTETSISGGIDNGNKFTYYDENENKQSVVLLTVWGNSRDCGKVDKWFHYNETTKEIQICTDTNHHYVDK